MRNPKEDRRVRRTQKLLKESLVQLMSEKAFKDITIKDITERADLNRGTFYLHYSDTYDLLTAMENGVLEDFQEMITAYMPSRPGNGLMPVLLPIVHYIVENEQICKNLFENNVSNEFVTKFKELIRKNGGALIERLYPACQTADSEYFFEFITYGLIGIIKKWLDNGMPQTEEEIARSGLTYLALGHLHTASGLRRAGRTFYAWPGCPEGRGFDETGEKGVYLGQVTETGVQLDFVSLAGRRYLAPTLDITGRDPALVLEEALAQAAPQDILRLRLTGQREEDAPPDLAALTARAAACCYRAEVVDETVLSRAMWDRQGEDTLTGLFLQTMARRLAQAPAEERPLLERAVRFGLAALEGREEPT